MSLQIEITPLEIVALSLWVEELARCPTCGSLNTRQNRGGPALRVCEDCSREFDPYDSGHVQACRQAVKDTFRGMEENL